MMKSATIILILLFSMGGGATFAEEHGGTRTAPTGSPGDWIDPNDYPPIALRFGMEGNAGVKVTVDTSGMPTKCDVVESSGFDVLDEASCDRLMAKARFQPAKNADGKLVEDSFTSRIIWRIPNQLTLPMIEGIGTMAVAINQSGVITSCNLTVIYPVGDGANHQKTCPESLLHSPAAYGIALRQGSRQEIAYAEVQTAMVFSPMMRQRALSYAPPGYRQLAMDVYRFTIRTDGRLANCVFEEQRGDPRFATQFCGDLVLRTFEPPASAKDKDAMVTGWNIVRVLVRQP